jgi:Carboxypeptidase regulatory-like domain
VLQPGGTISGTVTSTGGHPLAGICVAAFNAANKTSLFSVIGGGGPGSVQTDGRGGYTISGLAAGRYHVGFVPCIPNSPYQQQWYHSRASEVSATAVRVKAGATTSRINGRLAIGGTISGRVDTPVGRPLRNICVEALDLAKGYAGIAFTGKTGKYTVTGLNSDVYTVEFVPCSTTENRVSVLATARVRAPKATTGVNAVLAPGGSLSGTLTAAPSGAAVQGECVEAISTSPTNPGGIGYSGLGGKYTVIGLAKGTYQVFVADPECLDGPADLAPQWYDNQPAEASANPVSVSVGATTPNINAALQLDGDITGTVSGPSATALSGICVTAVPVSGYALTDGVLPVVAVTSAGGYTLEDLLPGQYKVEFSSGCGATGYATQWWQDASSEATATSVTVNAGEDVPGISATLTS